MDEDRQLARILTAFEGHVEVAKLLLERGTKVSVREWLKAAPLNYAAQYDHSEVVKLLLCRRANPSVAAAN
jgi:ankyrin repeat protein